MVTGMAKPSLRSSIRFPFVSTIAPIVFLRYVVSLDVARPAIFLMPFRSVGEIVTVTTTLLSIVWVPDVRV